MTSRWYETVPKTPAENIQWRLKMRQRAASDKQVQRQLRAMCMEDTLFWFAAFCWVFEPRPEMGEKSGRRLPFIPWKNQEYPITRTDELLGQEDVPWDKARGEGASWAICTLFSKYFTLSEAPVTFGLASKTLPDVCQKGDPSCLMWKIDYQLSLLPEWMKPEYDYYTSTASIINNKTGSTIIGKAATDNLGTGGRMTAWLWDEMAKFPKGSDLDALNSTEPTTNCRIMVSSPWGTQNKHHEIVTNPPPDVEVIVLDWTDNPTRNRGLFVLDDKQHPVFVDAVKYGEPSAEFMQKWPDYRKALDDRGYEFTENRKYSPWSVSRMLKAGMTPHGFAQEYERDPEGTEAKFFSATKVEKRKKECAQRPLWRGRIEIDADYKPRFLEDPNGPLRLWQQPFVDCPGRDTMRHLPTCFEPCCLGNDISQGTGGAHSSNSVCAILGRTTGEQIGEYVTRHESPTDFAQSAAALGFAFGNGTTRAFLNFENDGAVGQAFWGEINRIGYGHVYVGYHQDKRGKKKTGKPGVNTQNNKQKVLTDLRTAYYAGDCVIRSEEGHDELLSFVFDESGDRVIHNKQKTEEDLSGRGKSHADRGIAYGVAWMGVMDRPTKAKSDKAPAPPGSAAYRKKQRKLMEKQGCLP